MSQELPDHLTPCTPAEMYSALGSGWRVLFAEEPKRSSLLVLLCQWAEETGRGKSCHANNVANAKWTPGDPHDWVSFRCNEIIGGKEVWFDPPHPACRFRAYPDLAAGVLDYLSLLAGRFKSAWPAVLAGDPGDFAHRLKIARFYTASEALYVAALLSLYREFDRTIPLEAPLPYAPNGGQLIQLDVDVFAGKEGLPGDEPPEAA